MSLAKPPSLGHEPPPQLSISQLISVVRDELEKNDAERQKHGRQPLFRLAKMEITVQFVVNIDESIEGGFDLKVVSVGGKQNASSEKTQTVVLTYDLLPQFKNSPQILAV